ncbi:MAG TPA: glycosyltransferase family 9 protein [archaeon]|nr:glycosyltransferase family 9 protein [archaeon]
MPGTGRKPARILLVRNDRIGDLVLTTPAVEVLGNKLPGSKIDLLCSAYAEPVVRRNPYLSEVLTDRGAHDGSDLKELTSLVREHGYDCAVVLVHSLKNARLVKRAGILLRIGPFVRWYAPFYFNRAVRQKRSRGEKSEAVYNIDLLRPLGIKSGELPPAKVLPDPKAVAWAESFCDRELGEWHRRPLVVVHPGMGGSALNWPEDCWKELVWLLERETEYMVLVTGSDNERGLLARVTGEVRSGGRVRIKTGMSLEHLIGLLSLARVVAAPSTGPLHLAAAMSVPTVGIYSPVRAHHPVRWGPVGRGRIKIFLPPVDCPGTLRCLENRCPLFPCMGLFRPEEALEYIRSIITG